MTFPKLTNDEKIEEWRRISVSAKPLTLRLHWGELYRLASVLALRPCVGQACTDISWCRRHGHSSTTVLRLLRLVRSKTDRALLKGEGR